MRTGYSEGAAKKVLAGYYGYYVNAEKSSETFELVAISPQAVFVVPFEACRINE